MYMRLVGTSLDVYNYLEPLLNDYRKLKVKNKMGGKLGFAFYCKCINRRYINLCRTLEMQQSNGSIQV